MSLICLIVNPNWLNLVSQPPSTLRCNIKEVRVEQRAVFIVGSDDTIRYVEYVPEIAQHPNYEAALTALEKVIGK
jgi:peroxiredoxin